MSDITLEKLVNKKVNYKGEKLIIKSFRFVSRNTVLSTNKRTMVLKEHEVESFLNTVNIIEETKQAKLTINNLKEKKETPMTENKKIPETNNRTSLAIYEPTESQKKVQDALLTMLDKVQEDSSLIPQAKAVCDIANTLVSIEKTQIQLHQLSRKN